MKLNTIYNENCLQTLRRMPDEFLNMTLCSPPYDDLRTYNGYDLPLDEIIQLLYQKTKDGGVVVWVVGDKTNNGSESLSSFDHAISFVRDGGFNLHDTMIYHKNNPIPSDCGKRYRQTFEYMFCFSKGTPATFNPIKEPTKSAGKKIKAFRITQDGRGNVPDEGIGREIKAERKASNVFSYNVGTASATDRIAFQHPAIFPERLAEDQIMTWTNEGDLVYDCFMGSGTTAVASCNMRRNFLGSEISEEYVEIANERLTMYRHKVKNLPTESYIVTPLRHSASVPALA